jgi:hypothetical protein
MKSEIMKLIAMEAHLVKSEFLAINWELKHLAKIFLDGVCVYILSAVRKNFIITFRSITECRFYFSAVNPINP